MPSDTHVPAGPSLAGRFAAAIALTIGFYVLALVLGVGLLAFAVVPWFVPGPQNIFISFGSLVLGGLDPGRDRPAPASRSSPRD